MKKTTLITIVSILFCVFNYAQGTLSVSGNGIVISNSDTTPSLSDGTNFGDVGASTSYVNSFQLVNLENGGNPSKRLNNITVAISGSSDFYLNATSFGSLKGNDSPIDLNINFSPSSTGLKFATVTITFTNGTNSPYIFNIQGNGIILPADINISGNGNTILDGSTSVSTSNYTNFSNVNNGSSLVRTFTIENTGGSDLTNISTVSLSNNSEFQVTSQPATTTLSTGASTTFEITFSPVSSGNYTDTVTITCDDADESPYTFAISGEGAVPSMINENSDWKYLDNGSNQGVAWYGVSFDDSSWASGVAELGYGDGGEATLVSYGSDANNKYITTYFRKTFNVSNPNDFDYLIMEAIRDDGMVVYLNGVEVWRDHITGTVNYNTLADGSAIGGVDETTWISQAVSNSLVAGTNVIAVEIHQQSVTSSDISFNFRMNGAIAGSANVIRGPYLQKGSPSSVVVRWRTDVPTESVVNYGTSLGLLGQSASDLAPKTEHEIEITGLTADTKYYYEIANNSGIIVSESIDLYFETHPTVGTSKPYKFWILGDAGTANSNQRAVRDAYYNYIGSNHTDGILFLGDNAYNSGTDSEYQNAMFENMYEDKLKNSIAWSTLGNHDGYSADSNSQTGPYYDIFTFPKAGESGGMASGTEAYYSFDYGNIHFIVLDSYETDRSVGGTMYNWAQSDIQNTTQEWIVAFWHHPPYTKGSHDSDTESELIDMRQNFLPMLEGNGVDLVLNGHSHSYERSYLLNGHYGSSGSFDSETNTVGAAGNGDGKTDGNGAYVKETSGSEAGDGAVYITTGSAGKISGGSLNHNAMYASLNQLGSCILEIDGNTLHVKFIRETGVIDDYFTIKKGCTTDSDNDGVCDADDQCPGFDDTVDVDNDNIPDGCDPLIDSDGDGVSDTLDQCPGFDDAIDVDNDNIPDGCDPLVDSDGDGVSDAEDQCPGFDDAIDVDNDNIPDGCDSLIDSDGDGVSDAQDQCPGFDDTIDVDNDNIPDGCDSLVDSDGDGVSDAEDQCPGFDDAIDSDGDGNPDGCDICPGFDDTVDVDNDNIPDGCDSLIDSDGDGVSDAQDQCPGFDDTIDVDNDNIPDGCDSLIDSDGDGVSDTEDQCPGFDDGLIGTSCDDGDPCTENDIYDANCGCSGTPVADNDGDGYCSLEDPDDNNPCVPDANSPACDNCLPASDFFTNSPLTHIGNGSSSRTLNLPANSEDVSFTISNINEVRNGKPDFRFIDRVVVTYIDGNGSNQTFATFLGTTNSTGSVNIFDTVQSITVRLNDDYDGNAGVNMSVDLSQVTYCTIGGAFSRSTLNMNNVNKTSDFVKEIEIYPVPASRTLYVDCKMYNGIKANISLYNIRGRIINTVNLDGNYNEPQKIDIDKLSDGLYLLVMKDLKGNVLETKRILVRNE